MSASSTVPGAVASLTWAAPAGVGDRHPPGPVHSTYYGLFTRGYLQYADLTTGLTLVAVPGGTYHLAPASGQTDLASPPNDGWWAGTTMGGPLGIPAHFTAADVRAAPAAAGRPGDPRPDRPGRGVSEQGGPHCHSL